MKIRDRLALFLTLSAAGIMLVAGLIIWYGSAAHRKQYFLKVLQQEVSFRGQQLPESSDLYAGFPQNPEERISAADNGDKITIILPQKNRKTAEDSLKSHFPPDFVEELFREKYADFQAGEKEGAGRVFEKEEEDFVVVVAAIDRQGKAQLENLKTFLLAGFLLSVPLLYLFGRLSARHILKPLAGKIQKARRISASNLHLRLIVYNEKDEIGQLAIAFNEMLDRLETSFEMQRNFISNASHEIKNPLTAIIGEAEVSLERRRKPEEYIESLLNISKEADRLDALVDSLFSLAKTGFEESPPEQEETRLDEVLLEARLKADRAYPENRIKLDFSDLPENPELITIYGNPNLLQVAFTNLIENACKFSGNQEVHVKLSVREKAVQFRISDKGVGIPPQDINNILQPFYRAGNARTFKGFGIGLSLTDKIIRLHRGQMVIVSEEGKGTTIEIDFTRDN